MTLDELLVHLRRHRYGVQSSVAASGAPQAAVVGFAVTDAFEIVFDTLETTRKAANLRRDARAAFVVGGLSGGEEWTVQYEGVADEPQGAELERLLTDYYRVFPDGPSRRSWPGLVYVRLRPAWIRFSDFDRRPPLFAEFDAASLRGA